MSSSSSPCAACKFLRRKCTQECVFAPYFPPDHPQKFANVHKVFGASNVTKILNELPAAQREDAVNSLAYEAEARLRDPVYGCVGFISLLQQKLKQIQTELHSAKQELATYVGPSALMPALSPGFMSQYQNMNIQQGLGPIGPVGPGTPSNVQQPILTLQGPGTSQNAQHHQRLYDQQQLVEAAREQEFLRNLEQQQQLQQLQQQHLEQQHQLDQQSIDLMRFNRGFDGAGPSGQVTASGFTHLTGPGPMSPSLALGGSSYDDSNNMYQIQQQQPHEEQLIQHQLLLQQQAQPMQPQQPQPHHGDSSQEDRSIGPSS